MAASYPSSLKDWTNKVDDVDTVQETEFNEIAEEIVAIQTELGTDVAGGSADLAARLTALGSGPSPNRTIAYYESDQELSMTTGAVVRMDWEDVIYDPLGQVTTGGSWLFTADSTGYYFIMASAAVEDWDWGQEANFAMNLWWSGSGSLYRIGWTEGRGYNNTDNHIQHLNNTRIMALTANDTLYFEVGHDSGSTRTLHANPYFNKVCIMRLL